MTVITEVPMKKYMGMLTRTFFKHVEANMFFSIKSEGQLRMV